MLGNQPFNISKEASRIICQMVLKFFKLLFNSTLDRNSLNPWQQGQSSRCVIRRQHYSIPKAHNKRKVWRAQFMAPLLVGAQTYAKTIEHTYLGHANTRNRNHVGT